jgi:hypothetical protein
MTRLLITIVLSMVSTAASAVHNANMTGVITMLSTYSDGDYIYIQLSSHPAHPTCNNQFFVIPSTIPENRRNSMLARLMLAKATGEAVIIGYDAVGDCAHGYIQVHRVG